MIVIDENIPYIKGVFEPFTDVIYAKGIDIDHDLVKAADGLIVRTRTKCNEKLLKNSAVKFIASATIGTDHIDKTYCDKNNINWSFAPGCNADGVAHYMFTALQTISSIKKIDLTKRTIGVVGAGNVGRRVIKVAEAFGMRVLVNDPPRERVEGSCGYVGLNGILKESDIITLHVPLNKDGEDKTLDLVNNEFLGKLNREVILINTCRGEVVNQDALLNRNNKGLVEALIMDVWPNEPDINIELLNLADIATPHIAGYSINGKLNATTACVRFIGKNLGYPLEKWEPLESDIPEKKIVTITSVKPDDVYKEIAKKTYDILSETSVLKASTDKFESLRNNYNYRYEASNFILKGIQDKTLQQGLSSLGFNIY